MKARLPAQLTNKQRRAMDDEIRRQCGVIQKQYNKDIELMILYTLHVTLGFGKSRLKRFYDEYIKTFKELSDRYEFEPDDVMWLIGNVFKKEGIEAEEWINNAYKE